MIDLARWPALVLTAGLGTRLRPLSDVRAKAALPVAGQPLIARILRWLHASGVRRVVLNLHHRPHTITREVGDGSPFGLDVRYAWEPDVLGSAGGPARAWPLLAADRALLINGDTLADVDLGALADDHVASGALVTMAVVAADLTRYNALVVDADGAMIGSVRAGSAPLDGHGHPVHFIGVQAVNAAAFGGVDPDRASETVREVYPALAARRRGSVRVRRSAAEFFDIGTPAGYLETVARIASREGRELDRGRHCDVDATASVTGSVLWDRVTVRAGAEVRECVVADDVDIPAGARYQRCAVTQGPQGPVAAPFL